MVAVEADAGAEGGLEEVGVSGGDAVPAESVEVGGEEAGRVEIAVGERVPGGGGLAGVQFVFPENFEGLALGVVVNTGEFDEVGLSGGGRSEGVFD